MKIAIAVDEIGELFEGHFGDAPFFLIYDENFDLVDKIRNVDYEEKHHGDPVKAKHIMNLLSNVDVLIAKQMGPNIQRVAKRFMLIFSKVTKIDKIINILKDKNIRFDKSTILYLTDNNTVRKIPNKFL